MECIVQYLDNLEDLIFAAALKAERALQLAKFFAFMAVSAALQVLGILLALRHPPLALGVAALLAVGALFRAVVGYPGGTQATIA